MRWRSPSRPRCSRAELVATAETRRSLTGQHQPVSFAAQSYPEAGVRLGSVALRSAGEVKFPTGDSLVFPLRSVTWAMPEHFHQPDAKSLRQLKMPAWARHAPLTGPSPRAPRILATGCAPSATTAIQLVLSSATTVPRRCT